MKRRTRSQFYESAPGLKFKQLDSMSGFGGSKIQEFSNQCGAWLGSFSLQVQMRLGTFRSPRDSGLENFSRKTTCRFFLWNKEYTNKPYVQYSQH